MLRKGLFTLISIPAFAVLYLFTAVMVATALVFVFFNKKGTVNRLAQFWARTILLILGKHLHIYGKEHIDRNKKYIIVTNHASIFDINAIMTFYPGVSWFGREYLMKIPVFGKLLKMMNYIPLKDSNFINTKMMVSQLIEKSNGSTIAIFPEGTRTIDGRISKFYRGFVHIMKETGMELLPVTLNGFYTLKPKTRFHIDFGSRISAVIHRPMSKTEFADKKDDEILNEVRGIIESAYQV